MRSIIFKPWEVLATLDRRKHLFIRPAKPNTRLVPQACPYGNLGDLLYVKETWGHLSPHVYNVADAKKAGPVKVIYKATDPRARYHKIWFHPSYMSEEFSRITIEICGVWVGHLQDITEEGAKLTGVLYPDPDYKTSYMKQWNTFHMKPRIRHERGAPPWYECYPWDLEGFKQRFPNAAEEGVYLNKPLVIHPNPVVWAVQFNVIDD